MVGGVNHVLETAIRQKLKNLTGELSKGDLGNSQTQATWAACLFLTFYSPLYLNLESVKNFLAAGIGQREDDTFRSGLVGVGDYPR